MKCWHKDCRESEFSDIDEDDVKKFERYGAYVLPLRPVTCDHCSRRNYALIRPIWDKNRKIAHGAVGGLVLLFLLMSLFGGGDDQEGPVPEDPTGEVAVAATDETPAAAIDLDGAEPEDLSVNAPSDPEIQVSAFVSRQIERNKAKLEGRRAKLPPPEKDPKNGVGTSPERPEKAAPEPSSPSNTSVLEALRVTVEDAHVVLRIDGQGTFDQRKGTLVAADKYVIDLQGAWRVSPTIRAKYTLQSDLLLAVRTGKHPDHFRLVLDLQPGRQVNTTFEKRDAGLSIRVTPTN